MAFQKGFGSVDNDVNDLKNERAKKMATRFRMKDGETRHVIFLDDDPTVIDEYMIEGADWKDREFATKPDGTDRFAAIGLKPTKMYFWTVLDVTRDKDGKPTEFRRLYCVRADMAKMLQEKRNNWQGFLHKPIKITRVGARSSSAGSDLELILLNGAVNKVDMSRYKAENRAPFDYEVVLAPPGEADQLRLLGKAKQGRNDAEAVSLGNTHQQQPAGNVFGAPAAAAGGDSGVSGGLNEAGSDIPF